MSSSAPYSRTPSACEWLLVLGNRLSKSRSWSEGVSEFLFVLYICCPILVNFSTRDKDIMLMSICELREHWCREGRTFGTDVKQIIFTRVRETF